MASARPIKPIKSMLGFTGCGKTRALVLSEGGGGFNPRIKPLEQRGLQPRASSFTSKTEFFRSLFSPRQLCFPRPNSKRPRLLSLLNSPNSQAIHPAPSQIPTPCFKYDHPAPNNLQPAIRNLYLQIITLLRRTIEKTEQNQSLREKPPCAKSSPSCPSTSTTNPATPRQKNQLSSPKNRQIINSIFFRLHNS